MVLETGALTEKARSIRLLAMDVDGVLTSGDITYLVNGEEIKTYNVKDGLGLSLCHRAGLITAIITGRNSPINEKRAAELEIRHVFQGIKKKLPVLQTLVDSQQFSLEEVAYIGDDLPDLEILNAVGLSACPVDAVEEVRNACHYICTQKGGQGAVRELIDFILKAQAKHPAQ